MKNSVNATPTNSIKYTLQLFSPVAIGNRTSEAMVDFYSMGDSLYAHFISINNKEITNIELRITDFVKNENLTSIFPITKNQTLSQKLVDRNFLIAMPLTIFSSAVIIEARAFIKSASQSDAVPVKLTETKVLTNRVKFNPEGFTFTQVPSGLNANIVSAKTVTASWVPVENAIRYKVRCHEVGSETWISGTVLAPGNQRPFVNLKPDTKYEFQVQAYIRNEKVDSTGYSALATFMTSTVK
ncbi:hypothetical protein LBMAG27_10160 [Bacteroidota bacterium]|nr:hypothetical protein LBMAG27_10160 [Bacteroidota bacterium]